MAMAADEKTKKLEYWLECIKEWYPNRHHEACFLPPVFFKRKNYLVEVIADQPVLVPQPPCKKQKSLPPDQAPHYPHREPPAPLPLNRAGNACALPRGEPAPLPQNTENLALNDATVEHVFRCLQAFSQQKRSDAMMVISELDFRKLPRPESITDVDGDFDILIIHRRHGLIACEIKAVGNYAPGLEEHVKKVVDKASEQLKKAKKYLTEFLRDMKLPQAVNITTSLVLPNVTSSQVMDALEDDPQSLYDCVDSADMDDAIKRCLCKDKMPSIEELNALGSLDARQPSTALSAFSDWWQEMTAGSTGKDLMPEGVYDELLARFCGDAATVEVFSVAEPRKALNAKKHSTNRIKYTSGKKPIRTPGQAVGETGLIMSLLTLYPDQVELLLNNSLNCVHLYGPPGTGKTIVLYLKACQWLEQGHDVHVISLIPEGLAVSHVLERQLKEHPAASGAKVHHRFIPPDFKDVIIKKIAKTALKEKREMYVIVDEVISVTTGRPRDDPQRPDKVWFEKVATILREYFPKTLSLWSASMERLDTDWLQGRQLTTPLRTPPAVTREVAKSLALGRDNSGILPYSCINSTATTTGVNEIPVQQLQHSEHEDSKKSPMYCNDCGKAVIKFLKKLDVGEDDSSPLQYRDVSILCSRLPDESQEGGILGAFGLEKIPFRILKKQTTYTKKGFRSAVLGQENCIIVSDYRTVAGLERRVVIGMGVIMEGKEMPNRLMAMSRCSGRLLWIGEPTKA